MQFVTITSYGRMLFSSCLSVDGVIVGVGRGGGKFLVTRSTENHRQSNAMVAEHLDSIDLEKTTLVLGVFIHVAIERRPRIVEVPLNFTSAARTH